MTRTSPLCKIRHLRVNAVPVDVPARDSSAISARLPSDDYPKFT